jgi:hypothetical protein
MTSSKQLSMRLRKEDEERLELIKDKFGVVHDSEAIRIALRKATELEVPAKLEVKTR